MTPDATPLLAAHSVTTRNVVHCMDAYTVGSHCTGVGGFDLAFEAAGFVIAYQVEIDDFCNRVLEKHWPGVPRFRDERDCGKHNLPVTDVFVCSFPCQDISVAGKGAGIQAGTRSGLWFDIARLIGELRPRVVVLENVAAITVRGGVRVVADLAALGYDAEWGIVRASDVGAPHRRERWFCVAYDHSERQLQPQGGVAEFGGRPGNGSEIVADAVSHDRPSSEDHRPGNFVSNQDRDFSAKEPGRHELKFGLGNNGSELAYATSRGTPATQQPGQRRGPQQGREDLADSDRRRREQCDAPERSVPQPDAGRGTSWRRIQSRLGRSADGLPAWLDRPRWPARPGEAQHAWEPPRTVAGRLPQRANRLKALGNAVVPQCVYPIALTVREYLEAQDAKVGEAIAA